jgi:ribonuclease/clavin/mitogillin
MLLINDGDVVELAGGPTLTAVHTPGHAPGHLCFSEAGSGALVAGDMVAGVGTIIVEPHDGDMTLYLESLRLMSSLEPSMLLPAHGGVIRDSQQWLDYYESHRLMREQKIFDALSAFAAPALPTDIVADAYDDAPKAVWPLALRSIEAHLIKLFRDGRVARDSGRWALV